MGSRLTCRNPLEETSVLEDKPTIYVYGDHLFVAEKEKSVISAYDLTTSKLLWSSTALEDDFQLMVADKTQVYYASTSRDIVALDIKTGKLNWQIKMDLVYGLMPFESDLLYVERIGLVSLNKITGQFKWLLNHRFQQMLHVSYIVYHDFKLYWICKLAASSVLNVGDPQQKDSSN